MQRTQTCRELQNTFTSRVLQWDTLFHRIDKDFVIQGRDPNTRQNGAGREQWGTGGPVFSLAEEFNTIPHERRIVSMARSSDSNSAGFSILYSSK
jgi:dolichyl-diphosphooligosaccharide---protein glycosyltransferase